jgi:hypothetical protein
MTIEARRFPEADDEGFVSLAVLRKRAQQLSADEFVAAYPCPALLVVRIEVGAEKGDPKATVSAGPELVTQLRSGRSAFRYVDEVAFLVRRPAGSSPGQVTVGRGSGNDVVIGVDTISKLHGFFTVRAGRWCLTDASSTNGILLNDQRLEPGRESPLRSGDRILWGTQVNTLFLAPDALLACASG